MGVEVGIGVGVEVGEGNGVAVGTAVAVYDEGINSLYSHTSRRALQVLVRNRGRTETLKQYISMY